MESRKEQPEKKENQESEIDAIKLENEDLKRELKDGDEKIAGLEKSLAEKDSELSAANRSLDEAKQVIVETSVDLSEAVAAYREMAGQVNPGLVAEMIKGETINEIDSSLKSAKELVEKVRQEMEAESAGVRVPAGAPQRSAPDLSALTAREKIKMGVGEK
jgi:cell division septum initiation protein DivIVA